jgi:hypothetical protein
MEEVLTYDGISLGIGSKRNVEVTPVYDSTGRQITHHRIVVNVECIVAESTDIDDTAVALEEIKRRLSKPGKELVIENCGIGDAITIDGSGYGAGLHDIKAGPYPKVIRFDPLGWNDDSSAVSVVWTCEANVFLATNENLELGEILSFSYSARYAIDDRGWTTRTIRGKLEVPQKRYSDNQIEHNADAYRERIKIKKPEGFTREQEYDLSEDKAVLSFSIVDRQIPTRQAYPPGVVEISCNHRASRSRSQLATTRNQISFRCEVAANQPAAYAWFVFESIVGKRLNHSRQNGVQILIEEIEVDESIFGTEFSASVAYRGLSDVGSWLFNAGIFQPVTLSWDPWEQSVHEIEEPRGIANLAALADEQDRLTNLENQDLPVIKDDHHPHINYLTPSQSPLCNSLPTPEKSWAHFQAQVGLLQESPSQDQWIPLGPQTLEDGVVSLQEIGGTKRRTGRKETETVLPVNGGQITKIQFKGEAIRVGYEIPMPRLQIPNMELRLLTREFKPVFLGIHYCQPVFGAKWDMIYATKDLPKDGMSSGVQTNGTGYKVPGYPSSST